MQINEHKLIGDTSCGFQINLGPSEHTAEQQPKCLNIYRIHIECLKCLHAGFNFYTILQRRNFFKDRVIVSLTYQMNTSYETYIKMTLISNLMEDTYFFMRPLVLSIGAFLLVICNFACIRTYGTVDGLITFGFAGISFFN